MISRLAILGSTLLLLQTFNPYAITRRLVHVGIQGEPDASYYYSSDIPTRPALPPLSSLVQNNTIIGDVDFLLDFAIVGHCKTGTTFLANWLSSHSEIDGSWNERETHHLTSLRASRMVEHLYNNNQRHHPDQRHAYKAPRDIYNPNVVRLLAQYFPTTKLIVGLRSPLEYFESFYNYRIARKNYSMPAAELLVGPCMREMPSYQERLDRLEQLGGLNDQGVCTDGTNYHWHLSYLGKTEQYRNDPDYRRLLGPAAFRQPSIPVPNPVFLYEMRQLLQPSPVFRRDLQHYLNLSTPLNMPTHPPGLDNVYEHVHLNLCDPKCALVRRKLLNNGRRAVAWILRYFVDAPGVSVSEKQVFGKLLRDWKVDPCGPRVVGARD
jgi:hypothetical protein